MDILSQCGQIFIKGCHIQRFLVSCDGVSASLLGNPEPALVYKSEFSPVIAAVFAFVVQQYQNGTDYLDLSEIVVCWCENECGSIASVELSHHKLWCGDCKE